MSITVLQTVFYSVTFNGISGSGDITVSGTKSGDVLLAAYPALDYSDYTPVFNTLVTSDNTISQAQNTDQTARTFTAIMMRSTAA